jgi:hypothetical protein
LGVQGLIRKRRLTLTAIARRMESRCRIIHRVKPLWRFLNNDAVESRDAAAALALLVRYCRNWARFITARGALSFVSLAPAWVTSTPRQRRLRWAEAQSG